MVYFGHFENVAYLALNSMVYLVADLDWDFECAIYCPGNDICDMELMEFERHLVALVDYDFD